MLWVWIRVLVIEIEKELKAEVSAGRSRQDSKLLSAVKKKVCFITFLDIKPNNGKQS